MLTKFDGKINESCNWTPGYSLQKHDGSFTEAVEYHDIVFVGNGKYAISPYYTEKDDWMEGSAEDIIQIIAIK